MRGLRRILDSQVECFEKEVDSYNCTLQWLPRKKTQLQIFWNNEVTIIVWNPIAVLSIPKVEELQELQKLLENQEPEELLERTKAEVAQTRWVCCTSLPTKECKNVLDLAAGDSFIVCYSMQGTLHFLSPMGEDCQEKTDEGAFLQEEIEKIGRLGCIEGCLNCRWGKRRPKQKRKRHCTAVFSGELGPPTVLHEKHNIAVDADSNQGAMSPVFPVESLFCRNPGKNGGSREVVSCGSLQGVPVIGPIFFVLCKLFESHGIRSMAQSVCMLVCVYAKRIFL